MTRDVEYFRATMIIIWQARSGRTFTRHVDIGHVSHDADFDGLAVLNIGGRGKVVSHALVRT